MSSDSVLFLIFLKIIKKAPPFSDHVLSLCLLDFIFSHYLLPTDQPTPTPPAPPPNPTQKVHGFTRFMKVTFKVSEGSWPPDSPRPATCLDILKFLSGIMTDWHEHLTFDTSIFNTYIRLFWSVTFIIILFIMSCDNSCAAWLVGAANWTRQISIRTNYFVIPRPSFLRPLDVTFLGPQTQKKDDRSHDGVQNTYVFSKNDIIWPGHQLQNQLQPQ